MKEKYEWSRSWSDEAPNTDLPRVLLVGDSITEGSQHWVREALKGKAYVDFWTTSYGVNVEIYHTMLKAYLQDNSYVAVHFSHGLHAADLDIEGYEQGICRALDFLPKNGTTVALLTQVYEENQQKIHAEWEARIQARNEVLRRVASERGFAVNDLYSLSASIPYELRSTDGFHYTEAGFQRIAEQITDKLLLALPPK